MRYKASYTSAELEFGVAGVHTSRRATGGNPKSSSALLLSGVSGFGATYEYQFQTETPLRIVAALRKRE